MNIQDAKAFLDYGRIVEIENEHTHEVEKFYVSGNLKLRTYCRVIALLQQRDLLNNENDRMWNDLEIASEILKDYNKKYTSLYLYDNIDYRCINNILNLIINDFTNIAKEDYLKIPDIKVEKKANNPKSKNDDTEKLREKISQMDLAISNCENAPIYLMQEIYLVMSKTNNSYSEIMEMPITIFRDLVRTIVINENISDIDWNYSYKKQILDNLKSNGGLKPTTKPSKYKGADMKSLRNVLG